MTAAADLYDRHTAAHYDTHLTRPISQAENQVIYPSLAPMVNGRHVLDVGCGTGAVLDRLSPRSYLGLDSSPDMLYEARRKHGSRGSRNTFVCTDVQHGTTTIAPGVLFDTVLCLWAFPYLAGQVNTIKWMARHLAPGGWLIVQGWTKRYLRHLQDRDGHAGIRLHPTTTRSMRLMFELAHLEQIDVQGFRWLADHQWMDRIPGELLTGLFAREARVAPAGRCLTHFAYGRKPGHPPNHPRSLVP